MEQRPKSRRETSENRCPKPRRLPPSEPDRHSIARRWRRCPVRIEPQGLPAAPSASGHRALPHRIAAALLILAGLLTANCDSKSEAPRALPRYVVSVASPVRGDLPVYREWVGRLQAQVTAAVLPQVEGYVQERLFTNGQSVKRGDLLYRIDSRRYEQALEQARQKRSQAQADAVAAEQDVGYYAPLVANGAISRQQYTNAQQTAKAARAALQAAEAGVALAETNVAYCTLSSPVDGIMGFAEADVGSYVSPNGRSMVTVSRLDPLRVYFSVSEQEWLRQGGVGGPLSPGQKVEVLLPSGEPTPQPAVIVGADNAVDSSTGTIMLDASLPNVGAMLRPGMFVTVRALVSEQKDALLVPVSAVVSLQGKTMLVQLDAQNRASLVPVQTGSEYRGMVSVTGPISTSSRIVVTGTQQAMMAAEGRAELEVAGGGASDAGSGADDAGSGADDAGGGADDAGGGADDAGGGGAAPRTAP